MLHNSKGQSLQLSAKLTVQCLLAKNFLECVDCYSCNLINNVLISNKLWADMTYAGMLLSLLPQRMFHCEDPHLLNWVAALRMLVNSWKASGKGYLQLCTLSISLWLGVKGFSLFKAGKITMKGNICLGKDKIIEAWRSVKHRGDMSRWFGKKAERETEK